MSSDTRPILAVMDELCAAWRGGDGQRFGAPFAPRARFVAFDGSVLTGPAEIAAFHQRAFDSHLRGTALHLDLGEIRAVGGAAWLVFTTGAVVEADSPPGGLTGDSVQTFLMRDEGGERVIDAFQNTRIRPITDPSSADVWRTFDKAWGNRAG